MNQLKLSALLDGSVSDKVFRITETLPKHLSLYIAYKSKGPINSFLPVPFTSPEMQYWVPV